VIEYHLKSGEVLEHETICIRHLIDEEEFEAELKYDGMISPAYEEVDHFVIRPDFSSLTRTERLGYQELLKRDLGEWLEDDLSLKFHKGSGKISTLFLLSFIRSPGEEGDDFIRSILAGSGHIVKRFTDTFNEWSQFCLAQPGHQNIAERTSALPEDLLEIVVDNFSDLIKEASLHPLRIVGSSSWDKTAIDNFFEQFIEERK